MTNPEEMVATLQTILIVLGCVTLYGVAGVITLAISSADEFLCFFWPLIFITGIIKTLIKTAKYCYKNIKGELFAPKKEQDD